MRKSTAAVLAIASAFVLTAAAATAISVTGPFDPAAGSAPATTCDIGDTTIDSLTDGTNLVGFKLTASLDTSVDSDCLPASVSLRVDYTDTLGATQSLYASVPASVDYTGGGIDLFLSDGAQTGNIYSDFFLSTNAEVIPLTDETITSTTVLVSTTAPSRTCYQGIYGFLDVTALTGPINTLGNLVIYSSINGTCTGPKSYSPTFGMVSASSSTRAAELCSAIGAALTPELNGSFGDYWPGAPTDWWVCTTLFN